MNRDAADAADAGDTGANHDTGPVPSGAFEGMPGHGRPCEWLRALMIYDSHQAIQLALVLPMEDFEAGFDVSYDRALEPGELVLWDSDRAVDEEWFFACSDVEAHFVGVASPVVSGRVELTAVATGPDEVCGSPQTYAVTFSFFDLETADGGVPDIGPFTGTAGFFGDCYG